MNYQNEYYENLLIDFVCEDYETMEFDGTDICFSYKVNSKIYIEEIEYIDERFINSF